MNAGAGTSNLSLHKATFVFWRAAIFAAMLWIAALSGNPRLQAAGNVTVRLNASGTLELRGDQLSNSITIRETSPGTYLIEGTDSTTVNGSMSSRSVRVPNKKVHVVLNGGDDYLLMMFASFNILTVDCGSGDDFVHAFEVMLTSPILSGGFKLGSGNDTLALTGCSVDNAITVYGESDNDDVWLLDSSFGYKPILDGGGGYNELTIGACEFGTPLTWAFFTLIDWY